MQEEVEKLGRDWLILFAFFGSLNSVALEIVVEWSEGTAIVNESMQ